MEALVHILQDASIAVSTFSFWTASITIHSCLAAGAWTQRALFVSAESCFLGIEMKGMSHWPSYGKFDSVGSSAASECSARKSPSSGIRVFGHERGA